MAHPRAVVVAIVIAATSFAGWWLGRQDPGATADTTVPGPSRFAAVVTAPVDGDTVHVRTARGPETVRFLNVILWYPAREVQQMARKTRNVGIYVRISDDKAGDAAGVRRQEKDCRELAEQRGWHVVEVFEDNDIT